MQLERSLTGGRARGGLRLPSLGEHGGARNRGVRGTPGARGHSRSPRQRVPGGRGPDHIDFADWSRVPAGRPSVVKSTKEVMLEKVNPGRRHLQDLFAASQRVDVKSVSHPGAPEEAFREGRAPRAVEVTQGYLFEVDLDYLRPSQDETIEFESTYIDSFPGRGMTPYYGRAVSATIGRWVS